MANYLLISSAYRDRILYPNPGDFVVPFQQVQSAIVQTFTVLSTVNPLSVFPAYSYSWTNYNNEGPSTVFVTTITGGGGVNIILGPNVPSELLGFKGPPSSSSSVRQTVENCHDILVNYTAIYIEAGGNRYESAIVSYDPVYNRIATFEPLPFQVGDPIQIVFDPYVALPDKTVLLLPGKYNSRLFLDNDVYLYNITINEVRPCTINAQGSEAVCVPAFPPESISPTDKYLVYNSLYPFVLGSLLSFSSDQQFFLERALTEFSLVQHGSGYKMNERVFAVSSWDEEYGSHHCLLTVRRVDPSTGSIQEIEMAEVGCQEFTRSAYYLLKPLDDDSGTRMRSLDPATMFVLDVSTAFRVRTKTKTRDRDWLGNYFTVFLLSPLYNVEGERLYTSPNNVYPVPIPDPPIDSGDLYRSQLLTGVAGIQKVRHIGENEVIVWVQKFPAEVLDRFRLYNQLTPAQKQSVAYADALHCCVQNFVREGIVPLNFTGSYLTQSQMSCYEITVLNLILPNVQLDNVTSLLTSGYPYVLLEVSNVTMPSSGNKNVVYSNNPAAVNSTFICSISDVNDPIKTRFIKISSDGTVQTIKFSPADNLRFRILLPSGEPFLLQQSDYLPPSVSDPSIQIDMLIELKRV